VSTSVAVTKSSVYPKCICIYFTIEHTDFCYHGCHGDLC
jgi:hypothetical protein